MANARPKRASIQDALHHRPRYARQRTTAILSSLLLTLSLIWLATGACVYVGISKVCIFSPHGRPLESMPVLHGRSCVEVDGLLQVPASMAGVTAKLAYRLAARATLFDSEWWLLKPPFDLPELNGPHSASLKHITRHFEPEVSEHLSKPNLSEWLASIDPGMRLAADRIWEISTQYLMGIEYAEICGQDVSKRHSKKSLHPQDKPRRLMHTFFDHMKRLRCYRWRQTRPFTNADVFLTIRTILGNFEQLATTIDAVRSTQQHFVDESNRYRDLSGHVQVHIVEALQSAVAPEAQALVDSSTPKRRPKVKRLSDLEDCTSGNHVRPQWTSDEQGSDDGNNARFYTRNSSAILGQVVPDEMLQREMSTWSAWYTLSLIAEWSLNAALSIDQALLQDLDTLQEFATFAREMPNALLDPTNMSISPMDATQLILERALSILNRTSFPLPNTPREKLQLKPFDVDDNPLLTEGSKRRSPSWIEEILSGSIRRSTCRAAVTRGVGKTQPDAALSCLAIKAEESWRSSYSKSLRNKTEYAIFDFASPLRYRWKRHANWATGLNSAYHMRAQQAVWDYWVTGVSPFWFTNWRMTEGEVWGESAASFYNQLDIPDTRLSLGNWPSILDWRPCRRLMQSFEKSKEP